MVLQKQKITSKPPPYPSSNRLSRLDEYHPKFKLFKRCYLTPQTENASASSVKSGDPSKLKTFREQCGLARLRKAQSVNILSATFLTVFVAATVTLLFATGMQTSHNVLHQMIYSGESDVLDNLADEIVSVNHELHSRFAVPKAILRMISPVSHSKDMENRINAQSRASNIPYASVSLLSAFRRKSNENMPLPRAVFVSILGETTDARVRAVASMLAYAESTTRIPVFLWSIDPTSYPHAWTDIFANVSGIMHKAVLVDVPTVTMFEESISSDHAHSANAYSQLFPFHKDEILEFNEREENPDPNLRNASNGDNLNVTSKSEHGRMAASELPNYNLNDSRLNRIRTEGANATIGNHATNGEISGDDWAEFSLLAVRSEVSEDHVASIHEQSDANRLEERPAIVDEFKMLHREEIQSLDVAAAVNAHISIALSDEAVSRYAPRSVAATFVENGLLRATASHAGSVEMAYAFEYALINASDDTILRRLHDTFYLPYMLLTGMRPHMRRSLLKSFLAKQAMGTLSPRAIFVHAQFGLGNRLRALGSAIAFAKETQRTVVLIWVPDHHLNCKFGDLFVEQDDVIVSDDFSPDEEWPFDGERQTDTHTMHAVSWYNFMRHHGVRVNDPSELVTDDKDKHIFVATAYVIQSMATPFIIRTKSPYWNVLRSLTPHITVARMVENFAQLPMNRMMGVHIRSKRIQTDIMGVGVDEYSVESSTRTDYWRNLTQLHTFVEEMRRQPASQLFYVAADQIDVLEKLQQEFPSRIFCNARHCDGRERDCLPYALADIILLSRCATIRGSYWSSFSEIAVRIGAGRVLLAGIDFGKPQPAKHTNKVLRRRIVRRRVIRSPRK